MSNKKEKLLQKYLEKKKKQRKRDEILAQIVELEKKRNKVEKNAKHTVKLNEQNQVESLSEEHEEVHYVSNRELIIQNNESDTLLKQPYMQNEISAEPIYKLLSDNLLNEKMVDDEKLTFNLTSDRMVENEISTSSADSDFIGEMDVQYKDINIQRSTEIEEQRKLLPIYYEKYEIIHKLRHNTLICIVGETGCGKSTQIPQFIYEGLYSGKRIGVTQPRRMGAINVTERINQEMNMKMAGYQVRYQSTVTPDTIIKVMTDGILLKEIQDDFLLSQYSIIVLDEVHERSVNMDILIPLLSRILRLRKDFKLVFMSASNINSITEYFIEQGKLYTEKYITENADALKQVSSFQITPTIINVQANVHKVKIFYEEKDPIDYLKSVEERINKIIRTDKAVCANSILVFLPNINDIYLLMNKINIEGCVILPLHSKLSKGEQGNVYKEYDERKIILSTNIAETSVTISDIFYVIDTGLIKGKYVDGTGMVSYSVDYISKASAQQRAGRAGRTGPGICYRLYSGVTYDNFDETDIPKIHHEPLERVIVDLLNLGIRDINKFPFLNNPPENNINCAFKELKRLNVINSKMEITKLGRCMVKLPFTPRTCKLLCVSNTSIILPELIDIACILSCDMELRRNEQTKEYFIGEKSDLIVLLKIYRKYTKENKKEFSSKIGLSGSILLEVDKMSKHIKKQFGVTNENILDSSIKNQIKDVIYQVYKDRVCMVYDDAYWYRNNKVYPSNSSIDTEGKHVVFESLVKGRRRIYMKNITVLDDLQ